MRYSQRALMAAMGSAIALILVVGVVFVLASHKHPVKPRAVSHISSPMPPPSPKHKKKRPLTSPFTGMPIKHLRRTLIFKIDNVPQARPPTGLGRADIVYLLPVEGGLSRIMAVFSSHVPPVVGPVRSSREEDIKLLRQFGRPAFAYAGAKPDLLKSVEHARIVNLYYGTVGGYYRNYSRVMPYNLYANPHTLLREARHASLARDIGFRFGALPPGGKKMHVLRIGYNSAHFIFWWSPKQHRYLVSMDGKLARGANGRTLGGRTVVVQYTKIRASVFRELGVKCPYAVTVGKGRAIVLRNGRAYQVHWSRPNKNVGTKYTLPDGHRMRFARGQVWVIYGRGPGSTMN